MREIRPEGRRVRPRAGKVKFQDVGRICCVSWRSQWSSSFTRSGTLKDSPIIYRPKHEHPSQPAWPWFAAPLLSPLGLVDHMPKAMNAYLALHSSHMATHSQHKHSPERVTISQGAQPAALLKKHEPLLIFQGVPAERSFFPPEQTFGLLVKHKLASCFFSGLRPKVLSSIKTTHCIPCAT